MIPSILTQQVNLGLKDFLSTTFHSTNPFFHGMLDRFLGQDGNLSKGPYISLQLPFQKGQSREFFPEIPLGFTPHLHEASKQLKHGGPEYVYLLWADTRSAPTAPTRCGVKSGE